MPPERNKKLSLANEIWLKSNGYVTPRGVEFSDRYISILSHTTREGNSLKAPLDAVRKFGLIPKSMLPQVNSFEEYQNPMSITPEMMKLGEEFKSRFFINYERGGESDFAVILKRDSILVGGYAWPVAVSGIYPRAEYSPNHAFMVFKLRYFAFDNYEEGPGDWIKQLAGDYDFIDTGYRILISKEAVTPPKKNIWQRFLEFLQGYNLKRIYKLNYQLT